MRSAHLVDVHIALCSATGLENDQGEVVDELARDDLPQREAHQCCRTHANGISRYLICSLLDSIANLGIQPVSFVNHSGCLLKNAKRLDQGRRKALSGAANVEILQRTLGRTNGFSSQRRYAGDSPLSLCPPVAVCRDLEFTERITLNPMLLILQDHHDFSVLLCRSSHLSHHEEGGRGELPLRGGRPLDFQLQRPDGAGRTRSHELQIWLEDGLHSRVVGERSGRASQALWRPTASRRQGCFRGKRRLRKLSRLPRSSSRRMGCCGCLR